MVQFLECADTPTPRRSAAGEADAPDSPAARSQFGGNGSGRHAAVASATGRCQRPAFEA